MKRLFVLVLLLIIASIGFGQYLDARTQDDLFATDSTTLTNAVSDTSTFVDLKRAYYGNVRLSVYYNNASGASPKTYVDVMYQVAQSFGSTYNFKTVTLDSLQAADDKTVKSLKFKDYTYFNEPIFGFYVILRQTGTQVNYFKVEAIRFHR